MSTPISRLYPTLLLIWCGHFLVDFFIGIWPIYKTLANIDFATAGILLGLAGFLGDGSQLFFGAWGDRGNRKKCILLGMALASAAAALPLVHHEALFFLFLFLTYLGSGAFHPSGAGMLVTLLPKYKAFTMAFFISGGLLGLSIAPFLFKKIYAYSEMGSLFFVIPVLALCVTFLLYRHRMVEPQHSFARANKQDFKYLISFYWKEFAALYLSQVLVLGATNALLFFMPDFLTARNYPEWLAFGGGQFCFVMGSALLAMPVGYLSDRFDHKNALLIAVGGSILLFYLLLFNETLSVSVLMGLLFFLGAAMGLTNPLIVAFGTRLVADRPSTVSALLMGSAWCLGHFGPLVAGLLSHLFVVDPVVSALKIMGVYIMLSALLILTLPRLVSVVQSSTETAT